MSNSLNILTTEELEHRILALGKQSKELLAEASRLLLERSRYEKELRKRGE